MSRDLRVVIDTNVLISGSFGKQLSPPFQILRAIREQKVILITSDLILKEIKDVLSRKNISKLTKMSTAEQNDFLDMLSMRSVVTPDVKLSQAVVRDEKDDKFLACAVEGNADLIVTGDNDLLILDEYKGIKIITPKEFVALLQRI